jgi:hypothetical protein
MAMPQPINPNNSLNAEHVVYCASSGGGKTSAVKKLGLLKPTDQIVFLDPYSDYEGEFLGRQVRTYTKWSEFYRALRNARNSTRGFKIAMKPAKATPEVLEKFSQIVWACGNGTHKKPLKAVFEELAKMVRTSAKADGHFGEILTGGRKFAIHAHCCFQRGQEIPKTVFGQAAFKWIGLQERLKDARYISDELDIPVDVIAKLPKPAAVGHIEYVLKDPSHVMGQYKQGRFGFPRKAV